MKKFLAVFIVMIMSLTLFSVSCFAKEDSFEVLKGTPVMDGIVDEIYKQSVEQHVDLTNKIHTENGRWDSSDISGVAYLLYDDSHFYICAEVFTEKELTTREDSYIFSDPQPWRNDMVENWIGLEGISAIKVSLDPFGKKLFTYEANLDEGMEGVAKITDTGYVIEMSIPFYGSAGDDVSYSLQINDYDDANTIIAIGAQYSPYDYILSDKAVVTTSPESSGPDDDPGGNNSKPDNTPVSVVVTDADGKEVTDADGNKVTETLAAANTAASSSKINATSTSDTALAASVSLLVLAAASVIISKKRSR